MDDIQASGEGWDIVIMPPTAPQTITLPIIGQVNITIYFLNVTLAIAAGVNDNQLWTAIVRCASNYAGSVSANSTFTPPPWPAVKWLGDS